MNNLVRFIVGKVILVAAIVLVGGAVWFFTKAPTPPATSFEECAAEGNPIMESYPRQCRSKAGGHFTEDIGNTLEKSDRIRLTTPTPNMRISSPLTITGEIRGLWVFEGSFPVELFDSERNLIAQGYATTKGDWMTEDFLPFSATLNFDISVLSNTPQKGILVLKKDNPSGLPEYDDALEIPVKF